MEQGVGLIVASLLILVAVLAGIHRFLKANPNSALNESKSWVYSAVAAFGLAVIFALLPIESSAKNSVFSLLGILITAVIAISSTTFASNAMAGIMLRIIRNFKAGDFIAVGEHFGRVSETGFLHTEIQTKNRNLTTLPNMYLVTNAVTVMPADKVLVDASLSLGYDVSHHNIEPILITAAEKIGLVDAFVQISELGDFSISYRVAGFLTDPKKLLSVRSNLRKQVIDSLHGNGIEIVSPTFMNQRQYRSDETFISEVKAYQERNNGKTDESQVFDKAENAEKIEYLKTQVKTLDEQLKNATGDAEQAQLNAHKVSIQAEIDHLQAQKDKDA